MNIPDLGDKMQVKKKKGRQKQIWDNALGQSLQKRGKTRVKTKEIRTRNGPNL